MENQPSKSGEPCWACRVIGRKSPGCVVTETPELVVVMNPFPLNSGHALIMPRRHIENLYDLPDGLAGPILSTSGRVARAAKRAFAADGITLRQNNEAASDQHLFHFHLHVIPRFTGDGSRFSAPPPLVSLADQEAAGAQLRAAFAAGDDR